MHVSALVSSHYFGYGRRNHNLSGFVSRKSKSWPSCYSVSGGDLSSERRVNEVMLKQAALYDEKRKLQSFWSEEDESNVVLPPNLSSLNQAYDLCREEASREKDSTFYWGTMLMTPEQRSAFWALVVWCRRTDELVDGPNASPQVTPRDVDNWELRLEQVFEGRAVDALDVALSDTVSRFHLDIQLFKDMIEGMRMDLWKSRYTNFDELYQYSYHVAGTVGLISVPVMGIAPESHATTESVFKSALAFATANQLTNILRDVGEDARRGRVYLPQDELAEAGLSDDDIFAGKVTDKWRSFMHGQIQRVRLYFDEAEKGIPELNAASRWPVLATLVLYRQILDEIEANDYNNFTKRATVSTPRRIFALPIIEKFFALIHYRSLEDVEVVIKVFNGVYVRGTRIFVTRAHNCGSSGTLIPTRAPRLSPLVNLLSLHGSSHDDDAFPRGEGKLNSPRGSFGLPEVGISNSQFLCSKSSKGRAQPSPARSNDSKLNLATKDDLHPINNSKFIIVKHKPKKAFKEDYQSSNNS